MRSLEFRRPGERLSVLCLGAHSDDIEIGIGGTALQWLTEGAELDVVWSILSARSMGLCAPAFAPARQNA